MSSFAKKLLKRKPSSIKLQTASNTLPTSLDVIKPLASSATPANQHTAREKLSCTLFVIGAQAVGKTALVVRFLAKRFLPEYDRESDRTYTRAVSLEEKILDLTIIDKIGKNALEMISSHTSELAQADGLVVVFSCSDSDSFDYCLDLLDFFKFDCKVTLNTPTLVIGNKTDLTHHRKVSNIEAERCVLKYPGCSYEECSAAAQSDNVEVVFRSFIKQTLVKSDTREIQRNGRKSSIGALGSPKVIRAHFKRRFSMFGRDRTGST